MSEPDGPIRFDNETSNTWLSNFTPRGITLDGVAWQTAEHFYQAQKFRHRPALMELIATSVTAKEAKRIAHQNAALASPTWVDQRVSVMTRAVMAKFSQHADLQQLLLETGDREIIERDGANPFWSEGSDGSGGNELGKILMRARSQLAALHHG